MLERSGERLNDKEKKEKKAINPVSHYALAPHDVTMAFRINVNYLTFPPSKHLADIPSQHIVHDDDVSFYNSTASTWTLATPRTIWCTYMYISHAYM